MPSCGFVGYFPGAVLAAEGPGMDWTMLLIFAAPIVFVMWWISRSQKKREEERKRMVQAVQRGDKVVTVGGILGEVVRTSEREIVLAVDKSKGVELRFTRSAVSGVVNRDVGPKAEGDASGQSGDGRP